MHIGMQLRIFGELRDEVLSIVWRGVVFLAMRVGCGVLAGQGIRQVDIEAVV